MYMSKPCQCTYYPAKKKIPRKQVRVGGYAQYTPPSTKAYTASLVQAFYLVVCLLQLVQ